MGIMIWPVGVYEFDTWHAHFRYILDTQRCSVNPNPAAWAAFRIVTTREKVFQHTQFHGTPSAPTVTQDESSNKHGWIKHGLKPESKITGKVLRLNFSLWQFALKWPECLHSSEIKAHYRNLNSTHCFLGEYLFGISGRHLVFRRLNVNWHHGTQSAKKDKSRQLIFSSNTFKEKTQTSTLGKSVTSIRAREESLDWFYLFFSEVSVSLFSFVSQEVSRSFQPQYLSISL